MGRIQPIPAQEAVAGWRPGNQQLGCKYSVDSLSNLSKTGNNRIHGQQAGETNRILSGVLFVEDTCGQHVERPLFEIEGVYCQFVLVIQQGKNINIRGPNTIWAVIIDRVVILTSWGNTKCDSGELGLAPVLNICSRLDLDLDAIWHHEIKGIPHPTNAVRQSNVKSNKVFRQDSACRVYQQIRHGPLPKTKQPGFQGTIRAVKRLISCLATRSQRSEFLGHSFAPILLSGTGLDHVSRHIGRASLQTDNCPL